MSEIKFQKMSIEEEWTWDSDNNRYWVSLESPTFTNLKKAEEWLEKLKTKLKGGDRMGKKKPKKPKEKAKPDRW